MKFLSRPRPIAPRQGVIPNLTSTAARRGSATVSPHFPTGWLASRPASAQATGLARLPRVEQVSQAPVLPIGGHRVLAETVGARKQTTHCFDHGKITVTCGITGIDHEVVRLRALGAHRQEADVFTDLSGPQRRIG